MNDGIIADLKTGYGLNCDAITPVPGGWMNQKWKIADSGRKLLVKRFDNRRFDGRKLKFIESALQRQVILQRDGVPCPRVWLCEGRAIRRLDAETAYMVMDFCPGKMEGPDTITLPQMRSLGDACGRMHAAFSRLPQDSACGYPVDDARTLDFLWANFRARAENVPPDAPAGYREAVLALEPILKKLTPEYFAKLPKGIAHEDFSWDNMLFDENGLTAILDFDRSDYTYLWHDIGRALLSFALEGGRLNLEKIRAFREGYARRRPLTMGNIADALRLAWCVETPWWIQIEFFGDCHPKVARFKDEMRWLTENWPALDSLLGL